MNIGIVGATGEVGRTMLRVLEEKEIVADRLDLYASSRTAGSVLTFRRQEFEVQELTVEAMQKRHDYLLFSAGSEVSLKYAPIAEAAGNTVIDNSSAFRSTKPLVVPEINSELLDGYRGIIANPNCSTIQLVLALHPLHQSYALRELVVSTYQSVSGAGYKGMRALTAERKKIKISTPFPREIDLNVIPQIGEFDLEGNSMEEQKMVKEIRKILNLPALKIAVTTVRVPVMYGHAESVFVRCEKEIILGKIRELFSSCSAIHYHEKGYLTPKEIGESDESHVSRVRHGFDRYTLQFWNVAHNVRLGAATNAIKILEHLMSFKSN